MPGKYSVIIADPPWQFGDNLGGKKGLACHLPGRKCRMRGASAFYATMPANEISRIPLYRWVADDAVLALWVPCAMLQQGIDVMNLWGFVQKQVVVWLKRNASGKLAFGMGRQFRSCKEIALIGTRGSPKPAVKNERDVFECANLRHSRKPDSLHAALSRMYPGSAKLELFARRSCPDWTCVGLECEGEDGIKADLRTWTP